MLILTFARSARDERKALSMATRAAKTKQKKNIARPNATLAKLSMYSLSCGCDQLNGRERDNDYHTHCRKESISAEEAKREQRTRRNVKNLRKIHFNKLTLQYNDDIC